MISGKEGYFKEEGLSVEFLSIRGEIAIRTTTAASLRAQKDGFVKLASAGEYVNTIQGGIATSDEKIKQQPAKIARFLRAGMKGPAFFLAKREASIEYAMDALRLKDRDMAAAIYERNRDFSCATAPATRSSCCFSSTT